MKLIGSSIWPVLHLNSLPVQSCQNRENQCEGHQHVGAGQTRSCPNSAGFNFEVYGDPEIHPQQESYWGSVNPIGLRGCYDEGKRVAETLMMDYHRQNQVDIKLVRIFNTYGPRMHINDGEGRQQFHRRGSERGTA